MPLITGRNRRHHQVGEALPASGKSYFYLPTALRKTGVEDIHPSNRLCRVASFVSPQRSPLTFEAGWGEFKLRLN
jgi:hypothetical protein